MKRRMTMAAVALAAAVGGGTVLTAGASETVGADLHDVHGNTVGHLELSTQDDGKVLVELTATDQEPGFHGLHFHERGLCDPESQDDEGMTGAFLSAGGHYAPEGDVHGDHAGDLPPLYANQDGTGQLTVTVDAVTVEELVADDGSAIMIHEMPDNFANIPERYVSQASGKPGPDAETLEAGDSGDRVACGVVTTDG